MMDNIYKQCEVVHLWLGCPKKPLKSYRSPFALVEHFRDHKHFFELPGYWWDEKDVSWKCDTEDSEFLSMMDAFVLLHQITWWERAWTAQEAILPKVAIFRYGDRTLSLDDFWTCHLNRLRHLGSPCCVVAYQATGNAPGPRATIDDLVTVVDCVKSMQDTKSPYKTLLDVYRRFAERQSLNPRNKIYSLLGFLGPQMPRIKPGYTQPVGKIYVEAFRTMILERQASLSSLLGEGFNSGNFDLPSWVPDFSGSYGAPGYHLTRALRAYPLFNASNGRPGKLEIVYDRKVRVAGICIDRVVGKSNLINGARALNPGEIYEDWRSVCRLHGVNISTTARDEAFSNLLVGEMTEDLLTTKYWRLEEDDPDLPTDSQWLRYMEPDADGSTLPRPYRITVGCMVDRKALFVTSERRVGLSWPKVEVGDEVWILDGSNAPFLLRKPAAPCKNNHQLLIGDVYIYGVMHREAVEKAGASKPLFLV